MRSRTLENGYVESGIILNGRPARGIGGGICQIASTLYMAALIAEVDIVERRAHSLMIDYMPPATDATMAEGQIDLRFRNNTTSPMLIESIMTGNQHIINIYGAETRPGYRQIYFEARQTAELAPEHEIIEDASLPKGFIQIASPSIPGATYELYKMVYHHGKPVEEIKINTSSYNPIRGVLIIGTKEENDYDSRQQYQVSPWSSAAPTRRTPRPAN